MQSPDQLKFYTLLFDGLLYAFGRAVPCGAASFAKRVSAVPTAMAFLRRRGSGDPIDLCDEMGMPPEDAKCAHWFHLILLSCLRNAQGERANAVRDLMNHDPLVGCDAACAKLGLRQRVVETIAACTRAVAYYEEFLQQNAQIAGQRFGAGSVLWVNLVSAWREAGGAPIHSRGIHSRVVAAFRNSVQGNNRQRAHDGLALGELYISELAADVQEVLRNSWPGLIAIPVTFCFNAQHYTPPAFAPDAPMDEALLSRLEQIEVER